MFTSIWIKYKGEPTEIDFKGGNVNKLKKEIQNELYNKLSNFDNDDIALRHGKESLRADMTIDKKLITSYDKPIYVEVTNTSPDSKRRHLENCWKSYIAADKVSVKLPFIIKDMLMDKEFEPDLHSEFASLLKVRVRSKIMVKNLGQRPKHFTEGYQGTQFLIIEIMMNIWRELDSNSEHSIKKVLSGPFGVRKSYLAWFLAAIAYASNWLTLYIADASVLTTCSEFRVQKEICNCFFALNKGILTSAELGRSVELITEDDPDDIVISKCTSNIFSRLLKRKISQKSLFIVDEHGSLFNDTTPEPENLRMRFLKSLNFWDMDKNGTRVVLTGTAHARFKKVYIKNGMQGWVVYISPLSSEIFNKLMDEVFLCFHSTVQTSKNETRLALADIFLPGNPRDNARLKWEFLDFRIVYHVSQDVEEYNPICLATKEALLDLYKFLLETTDIAGKNKFDLHLDIKSFELLKKQPSKYRNNVLVRCYKGYLRFDFILGYTFFQVSISDFVTHDTGYARIELAFDRKDGNKNQIEEYLDSVYGGTHKIDLIKTTNIKNSKIVKTFSASKDGQSCDDFKIVYICGRPNETIHKNKVKEYPEVRHISYEKIKMKLFGVFLIP
ncbi:hypothetical protein C1645_840727 [Glomus cerebriforme]|uniref:Crinkler family protein n=1 Tax=Glomus cerebriforme TaxID=658196 RepID=A0A397S513_9GLOM|nr:hypothetical protein C1645_840727 [Glomus cerebriforme]